MSMGRQKVENMEVSNVSLQSGNNAPVETGAWNAEHESNCPSAPLDVKPYWRGSRPIYYRDWSEEDSIWYKGRKSPYRVMAAGNLTAYECIRHNAANADGSLSNYWRLADTAQVYDSAGTYSLVGDLGLPNDRQLATICEDRDVDILDYRF